jgi:hypothetical protein
MPFSQEGTETTEARSPAQFPLLTPVQIEPQSVFSREGGEGSEGNDQWITAAGLSCRFVGFVGKWIMGDHVAAQRGYGDEVVANDDTPKTKACSLPYSVFALFAFFVANPLFARGPIAGVSWSFVSFRVFRGQCSVGGDCLRIPTQMTGCRFDGLLGRAHNLRTP